MYVMGSSSEPNDAGGIRGVCRFSVAVSLANVKGPSLTFTYLPPGILLSKMPSLEQ